MVIIIIQIDNNPLNVVCPQSLVDSGQKQAMLHVISKPCNGQANKKKEKNVGCI